MNSNDLRKKFIEFFLSKGHKEMPPSTLIPENDPSVLFTTAGMQQFKRYYTSPEEAPAKNVVTIQPCLRTSDVDEVGDNTHLTFFEMLGNFSFGDYFKKETIEWGYEFLVKELSINPGKIMCSIFAGDEKNPRDDESAEILDKMGIKFEEHGRDDNFWGPTGNEGPCGPTVEFYLSPEASAKGDVDGVEVWNLVFNEYYYKDGKYEPLKTPGVDTGMGLERMLVVLNKKSDIFQTDLFWPIIQEIEKLTKLEYGPKADEEYIKDDEKCWVDVRKQMRITVDHIKAATFIINDEVLPSNKDAGYIVRRLIRRAVIKGHQLGIKSNFINEVAKKVFDIYSGTYDFDKENILLELEKEETQFRKTLSVGLKQFEKTAGIGSMPIGTFPIGMEFNVLTGKELFDLYQTYGFPLELSLEIAKNKNTPLEERAIENFNIELKKHQDLSRTASAGMFKGGLASGGETETKFHTATHLLLASLREILGKDVNQKGANINSERIRFDFNYPEKLTDEQIDKIEDWVNDKIAQNSDVQMEEMPLAKAIEVGATSILGFKYPETVKVFSIGDISREICGGPHVKSTGEIGKFEIIKEESSSAGVRRIRAILE